MVKTAPWSTSVLQVFNAQLNGRQLGSLICLYTQTAVLGCFVQTPEQNPDLQRTLLEEKTRLMAFSDKQ